MAKTKTKIKKVVITDNEGGCPLECNTGGKYFYSTVYIFKNNNSAEVKYTTSAEFDFCPHTAWFMSCADCSDFDKERKLCKRAPEVANLKEILKHIFQAIKEGHYDIEVIFSDGDYITYYGQSVCALCNQKGSCTLWQD